MPFFSSLHMYTVYSNCLSTAMRLVLHLRGGQLRTTTVTGTGTGCNIFCVHKESVNCTVNHIIKCSSSSLWPRYEIRITIWWTNRRLMLFALLNICINTRNPSHLVGLWITNECWPLDSLLHLHNTVWPRSWFR